MAGKLSRVSEKELYKMLLGKKHDRDEAFSEIYDRYARPIFKFCVYMTGDKDQADDIFQESFLKFYANIGPGMNNSNLQGYLFMIARNLCYNLKRDRKTFIPIDPEAFFADESNIYDKKELFELIKASLELISEENREVFILREFDGLSYKEIAEICGITMTCAKSRNYRAREQIVKILDPYLKDLCK